jgi:hypothetical protein
VQLDTFRRIHGHGDRYRALGADDARRLASRLPAELVALLVADGLCSYRDQLLWTVDDRDVEAARLAWLPGFPQLTVFARTAFGSLYLWDGGHVQVLLPHVAKVGPVGRSIARFFEHSLTDPGYLESGLHQAAVREARAHAGALGHDEMYGYQPALALGGSGAPDTVRRVRLVEQHILLAQLQPLGAA